MDKSLNIRMYKHSVCDAISNTMSFTALTCNFLMHIPRMTKVICAGTAVIKPQTIWQFETMFVSVNTHTHTHTHSWRDAIDDAAVNIVDDKSLNRCFFQKSKISMDWRGKWTRSMHCCRNMSEAFSRRRPVGT